MVSSRDIAITAGWAEPIHRETVMAMVARRIEQLVRSGDLKAGDRLPPEPDLAQMLGVSRFFEPSAQSALPVDDPAR